MKQDGKELLIGGVIIISFLLIVMSIFIITVDYNVIDEGLKREHMEKVIGLQENRARKILEASGWEVSVGEWAVTCPDRRGQVLFAYKTDENTVRLVVGTVEFTPPAP